MAAQFGGRSSISPLDGDGEFDSPPAASRAYRRPAPVGERLYTQRERMESLGQLAAGIAHDFNNLLEVILNYAALALDELDEKPAIRADIQEIERAARRAGELTRRLLSFGRREGAQVDAINLNDVVRGLESLLGRTLGEDIALEIRLDPDLWNVRGDLGQLEQVLVNLAVNARDAMPQGGRLEIATENARLGLRGDPDLPSGRCVRVTVTDTGVGMTDDVAASIYEPFFTTKPNGAGTGLGLATVYGIVERCGGQIDLVTAPGMGTTFVLHFPATDSAPRQIETDRSSRPRVHQDKTVLIVEDDDAVRRVMVRVLADQNYRVLSAPGAEEALSILEARGSSIDVLIVDLVMPGMSGRELVDEVAARHSGLPTVFISGYTDDFAGRREVNDTGRRFISKPFSGAELIEKVIDCLRDAERAKAMAG